MEAGEEKGGWETGFYFLIFTDIVKMGWDTKPARNEGKKSCISSSLIYYDDLSSFQRTTPLSDRCAGRGDSESRRL